MKLAIQCRCDWKKIAKRFDKVFTPYFLKMRYKELTSSKVHRKTKFTTKEDFLIAKYFDLFGTDWKRISQYLKDRTGVMVKNRYYSFIRKRDCMKDLVKSVQDYEADDKKVDDMASVDENEGEGSSPSHSYTYKNNAVTDVKINEDDCEDDEDLMNDDDDEEEAVARGGNMHDDGFAMGNATSHHMITKAQTEPSFFTGGAKSYMHQQQQTSFSSSPEKREIESLKEKVKSLEQLIVDTQKELALVKNQQRGPGSIEAESNNNNNTSMFY
jgi:hypothetical protein